MNHMDIAAKIVADAGVRHIDWLPPSQAERAASMWRFKAMLVAPPIDDKTLTIFAHEAGHLATTPDATREGLSILEIEYRASKWGADAIRRHGGTVTPAMVANMRRVLRHYAEDPDDVDGREPPEVYHFLKGEADL
jgi:hypothetical protein